MPPSDPYMMNPMGFEAVEAERSSPALPRFPIDDDEDVLPQFELATESAGNAALSFDTANTFSSTSGMWHPDVCGSRAAAPEIDPFDLAKTSILSPQRALDSRLWAAAPTPAEYYAAPRLPIDGEKIELVLKKYVLPLVAAFAVTLLVAYAFRDHIQWILERAISQ